MLERFFQRYKKILEKQVCDTTPDLPIRRLKHAPKSPPPLQISYPSPSALKKQRVRQINGHFSGELISSGRVIIGPKGYVKAHISLEELEVFGRVQGNISARRVVLHKSAYVEGNIATKSLVIEEGAKVDGAITLAQQTSYALASSAS